MLFFSALCTNPKPLLPTCQRKRVFNIKIFASKVNICVVPQSYRGWVCHMPQADPLLHRIVSAIPTNCFTHSFYLADHLCEWVWLRPEKTTFIITPGPGRTIEETLPVAPCSSLFATARRTRERNVWSRFLGLADISIAKRFRLSSCLSKICIAWYSSRGRKMGEMKSATEVGE